MELAVVGAVLLLVLIAVAMLSREPDGHLQPR
jgi:hypothetical protein